MPAGGGIRFTRSRPPAPWKPARAVAAAVLAAALLSSVDPPGALASGADTTGLPGTPPTSPDSGRAPPASSELEETPPAPSESEETPPASTIGFGFTAGVPQLLGLTFEFGYGKSMRLQATACTLVIVSSASARLVVIPPRGRLVPYAFLGGGVFHLAEGESGDWVGTTGFVWGGGGLRLQIRRVGLFLEVGTLGGMNEDRGLDTEGHAFAVGILVAG